MKANEFVKKFGLYGAKEYLAGATFFDDHLIIFTDIDDLKRLVEAHELVERHGGLFQSKVQLDKFGFSGGLEWYGEDGEYGLTDDNDLRLAILDVESCL